jgi:flavin reductase (DIM6/NTAB) family NADH-FMN oxidoreductase RutF/DNA-binding MarR family transcriptional regulator
MTASIALEKGDPREDSTAFRRCLGQFATGITVITAKYDGKLLGMTVNSFSSVSLDPPLILWSAKRKSPSFEAFSKAEYFAINVLSKDQISHSQHFGRSSEDKFTGMAFVEGLGGAPLLEESSATFECRRYADFPGGDHLVILGEVHRFCRYDREALLFSQGRYSLAADYEAGLTGAPAVTSPADKAKGPMNQFMTALLFRAHGVISEALEDGRKAEGLSLLQCRIMAAIETLPRQTLDDLLPELFLGSNAAANTVDQLKKMGLVCADSDDRLELTPSGLARNRSVLNRAHAIEKRILAGASEPDVAACRRVLAYLANDVPLSARNGSADPRRKAGARA